MVKSIWTALAAVCFLCMAGAAYAGDKPLTDADRAEVNALGDQALRAMDSMNAALRIASSDPAKACELMKDVETRSVDLNTHSTQLRDRLVTEGKTTEGVDQMVTGSAKMVNGAREAADGICSPAISSPSSPEEKAIIDKMTTLAGNFTTALTDAANAEHAGDHAAACGHYRRAQVAYDELYAYMTDLRRQIPDGTPEAAQFDGVIAKFGPVKGQLASALATCPAT